MEILVSMAANYPGVSLNKQSVEFLSGTNLNTAMVTSNNQVYFSDLTIPYEKITQSGMINLQLTGVNADIYALPSSTLTFNIVPTITNTPEITDIQLLQVTQTTAKIQFTCSQLATAYYLIALKGTPLPALEEFSTFGPATYETTRSMYGVYYIGQDLTGILDISGLSAETSYVCHVFLVNRANLQIQAPGYLEFNTTGTPL